MLRFLEIFSTMLSNRQVCIPQRPWDEHDFEANAGQLLCKKNTEKQIDNFSLENYRNLKIVRFQSLRFASKPKGYLL